MNSAFADTSVVLRQLLSQQGAIDWRAWDTVVASELLVLEASRTLDRWRLARLLPAAEVNRCLSDLRGYVAGIELMGLSKAVMQRAASPMTVPLKTLDAIHLASALLWAEQHRKPLVLLTHDRQLAAAARASGLEVRP